jgi:hypothetical protein
MGDCCRVHDRHDLGQARLVILLERAADPIEGDVLEPRALARHFRGWLALASLIESARAQEEAQGSSEADSRPEPPAEDRGGSPM